MPTDSKAVTPKIGSALFGPKITVAPTNSPMNSICRYRNFQDDLGAVGQLVRSLPFRLQANFPQVLSRNETINRAGIHKEKTFPTSFGIGGVTNRNGNVSSAHTLILARCRDDRH